jgi:hypothetical protein
MGEPDDDAPMPDGWTEAGYTAGDWRTLRASKRRMEERRAAHPPAPDFEDEVIALLRSIDAKLGRLLDRLDRGR